MAMQPLKSQLLHEYMEEVARRSESDRTIDSYNYCLYGWEGFVESLNKALIEVDTKDFFLYRDILEKKYAQNTIAVRMTVVKSFYAFISDMGYIEKSKYPEQITWSSSIGTRSISVPTYQEIIQIRQKRCVSSLWATAFELLLSSGLRVSEFTQLRGCDISFDDIPMDFETHKPSIYIGGSITLSKAKHAIKVRKGRKTYFSKIAAKVLRVYMKHVQIEEHTNQPIFPWCRQTVSTWLDKLAVGIITGYNNEDGSKTEEKIVREKGFGDIKAGDIKDEGLKRMIARRQRKAKQSLASGQRQSKKRKDYESPERRFHPHALRHAFVCINYYRNPFGEYRDLMRLKSMIGHSGSSSTTFEYLTTLDIINSMEQWERFHLGRSSDWINLQPPNIYDYSK